MSAEIARRAVLADRARALRGCMRFDGRFRAAQIELRVAPGLPARILIPATT